MSKKILLADDSVTIQKVVSITLAHEDFELIIVDNGTEAVIKANEIRPDVILLDVVMPDKDGYEVCQEIKANKGLATIPIILLTGTFEPFDEDKATEVGADDFIKKPFESHALINKIKEMVFKAGVKGPATVVDAEVEEIDGLDELEGIDDLSGFDDFETPVETRLSEAPINAPSPGVIDLPEVSLETPSEAPKPVEPIMTQPASAAPVAAPSPGLSAGAIDSPEVSLESLLDSPEISLETPSEAPKPAEPIMGEAIREMPHIETGTAGSDDIWSVEEVEDISGSENSSGLEEVGDLWGEEEIATNSEVAMPETAVIEEPEIKEDTIVLGNELEMTEPDYDDGGFELGSDISLGELETSADDSMFDDASTGAEVSGDDLFPNEIPEEPLGEEELFVADGDEFNDGGFGVETTPLDVPAAAIELPGETPGDFAMDDFGTDAPIKAPTPQGIELPGETPGDFAMDDFGSDAPIQAPTPQGIELPGETSDGFAMDDFETDAPIQAPTPQGIELPDVGIDDIPFTESIGSDSVELDWGDDSDGFTDSENAFALNDDFSNGGGDVAPTPGAGISQGFESAPSESIVGETEWNLGEVEPTPDTVGGVPDDTGTIAMGSEVEPQVEPQVMGDMVDDNMTGRSEEISRMVKETIVDGGILSEVGMAGKSEKEVGAAVDKVAREIVQKVVCEVVPELAEELIKDEIRRLKGEKEG